MAAIVGPEAPPGWRQGTPVILEFPAPTKVYDPGLVVNYDTYFFTEVDIANVVDAPAVIIAVAARLHTNRPRGPGLINDQMWIGMDDNGYIPPDLALPTRTNGIGFMGGNLQSLPARDVPEIGSPETAFNWLAPILPHPSRVDLIPVSTRFFNNFPDRIAVDGPFFTHESFVSTDLFPHELYFIYQDDEGWTTLEPTLGRTDGEMSGATPLPESVQLAFFDIGGAGFPLIEWDYDWPFLICAIFPFYPLIGPGVIQLGPGPIGVHRPPRVIGSKGPPTSVSGPPPIIEGTPGALNAGGFDHGIIRR